MQELRAFVARAVAWCRNGDEATLLRLLRSPYSGVPHDDAAAYATLAARTGSLFEAVEQRRLALPAGGHDALLTFVQRMRSMRAVGGDTPDDDVLRKAIEEAFGLAREPARLTGETPSNAAQPHLEDRRPDRRDPVQLAEPVPREAPSAVHPRQKHFSASALNTFAECPRKWFYRYACGAVEDRGSSASVYGTALHLALEDFHGEFDRPHDADPSTMRKRIAEHVTWAFERNRDGFKTRVEYELQRRRAQRTAQRYVDWLIATAAQAPFTVTGREVPANVEVEGHAFIGYIDRLDRDDRTGDVTVVDYKTGSIAADATEYREKIRRLREFQLPFYYWARTAQGDRVTRLTLLPLKDALLDVRPVSLLTDAAVVADLERAREKMAELCDELSSGRAQEFATAQDAAACAYCAYATACAGKPPAPPERFGR